MKPKKSADRADPAEKEPAPGKPEVKVKAKSKKPLRPSKSAASFLDESESEDSSGLRGVTVVDEHESEEEGEERVDNARRPRLDRAWLAGMDVYYRSGPFRGRKLLYADVADADEDLPDWYETAANGTKENSARGRKETDITAAVAAAAEKIDLASANTIENEPFIVNGAFTGAQRDALQVIAERAEALGRKKALHELKAD